jgi:hypothetical protein
MPPCPSCVKQVWGKRLASVGTWGNVDKMRRLPRGNRRQKYYFFFIMHLPLFILPCISMQCISALDIFFMWSIFFMAASAVPATDKQRPMAAASFNAFDNSFM